MYVMSMQFQLYLMRKHYIIVPNSFKIELLEGIYGSKVYVCIFLENSLQRSELLLMTSNPSPDFPWGKPGSSSSTPSPRQL